MVPCDGVALQNLLSLFSIILPSVYYWRNPEMRDKVFGMFQKRLAAALGDGGD